MFLQNCREEYGIHTCDLRSPRAVLAAAYPSPTFSFEDGFSENDPLWLPDVRETKAHILERAIAVLSRAFAEDATCTSFSWFDDKCQGRLMCTRTWPGADISITAHGGFINGFLNAIGRPFYSLPTGGEFTLLATRLLSMGSY